MAKSLLDAYDTGQPPGGPARNRTSPTGQRSLLDAYQPLPPGRVPATPAPQAPAPNQDAGLWSDTANLAKMGVGQLGQGAGYLTGIESLEQAGAGLAERAQQALSPAQQQAMQNEFITHSEEEGYGFGPALTETPVRSLYGALVSSLPATAAGMGVGGVAAKGLGAVGSALASRGVAGGATLARPAVSGAVGFGAGEGLVSAGIAGSDVKDFVRTADQDLLDQAPGYQELIAQGMDPATARETLAEELAGNAALGSGAIVGLLGAPMGAVFGRWMGGVGPQTMRGAVLGGAAGEAAQEAGQSAGEEYIGGTQRARIDPTEAPTLASMANQAVGGALAGGVMGGGFGAASGFAQRKRNALLDVAGVDAGRLPETAAEPMEQRSLASPQRRAMDRAGQVTFPDGSTTSDPAVVDAYVADRVAQYPQDQQAEVERNLRAQLYRGKAKAPAGARETERGRPAAVPGTTPRLRGNVDRPGVPVGEPTVPERKRQQAEKRPTEKLEKQAQRLLTVDREKGLSDSGRETLDAVASVLLARPDADPRVRSLLEQYGTPTGAAAGSPPSDRPSLVEAYQTSQGLEDVRQPETPETRPVEPPGTTAAPSPRTPEPDQRTAAQATPPLAPDQADQAPVEQSARPEPTTTQRPASDRAAASTPGTPASSAPAQRPDTADTNRPSTPPDAVAATPQRQAGEVAPDQAGQSANTRTSATTPLSGATDQGRAVDRPSGIAGSEQARRTRKPTPEPPPDTVDTNRPSQEPAGVDADSVAQDVHERPIYRGIRTGGRKMESARINAAFTGKGLREGEEFWTTDRDMAGAYSGENETDAQGDIQEARLAPDAKVLTLVRPDGSVDPQGMAFYNQAAGTNFATEDDFFNHVMGSGIAEIGDAVRAQGYDAVESMDLDGPELLVLNPAKVVRGQPRSDEETQQAETAPVLTGTELAERYNVTAQSSEDKARSYGRGRYGKEPFTVIERDGRFYAVPEGAQRDQPVHTDTEGDTEPATSASVTEAVQDAAKATQQPTVKIRKQLLDEVEKWAKSVEKGTVTESLESGMGRRDGDFVRFKVPGDGTFKVRNTPENLRSFADRVKKVPEMAGRTSPSQKGAQPGPITGALQEMRESNNPDDVENAVEILRLQGKSKDAEALAERLPGIREFWQDRARDDRGRMIPIKGDVVVGRPQAGQSTIQTDVTGKVFRRGRKDYVSFYIPGKPGEEGSQHQFPLDQGDWRVVGDQGRQRAEAAPTAKAERKPAKAEPQAVAPKAVKAKPAKVEQAPEAEADQDLKSWKLKRNSQSTTGKVRNYRVTLTDPNGKQYNVTPAFPKEEQPSTTEIKRAAFELVRRDTRKAKAETRYSRATTERPVELLSNAQGRKLAAIKTKASPDDAAEVAEANFTHPMVIGSGYARTADLTGGIADSGGESQRVQRLVKRMQGPDGFFARIVIDAEGNVLEGQHRLDAAQAMGLEAVPVWMVDDALRGLPQAAMEAAVRESGSFRAQQVRQIVANVGEAIKTEGSVQAARDNMEWPAEFRAAHEAALNAAESETRFARGQQSRNTAGPRSVAAVRTELNLNRRAERALLDSGLVTIVQSASEIPGTHPSDVAGAYHQGKVYLVADNIPAGRAKGLLGHELGIHHGLKTMVGEAQYAQIVETLKRQVRAGSKPGASRAAREAFQAHVRASADSTVTNPDVLWQETIAYLAEAGSNAPVLRRIMAAVRAFLRRLGLASDFTAADMAHLARGSIQRLVEGMEAQGQPAGRRSATMYHRVFHGTPHLWQPEPGFPHGRPRLDKIGTGEGHAKAGHGIYLAEEQKTGAAYREQLAGASDGQLYHLDIPDNVIPTLLDWDAKLSEQPQAVQDAILDTDAFGNNVLGQWLIDEREDGKFVVLHGEFGRPLKKTGGVHATEDTAIKTMEEIQGDIMRYLDGEKLYKDMVQAAMETDRSLSGPRAAKQVSEKLRDAGIPGNRYLDAGSRGEGDGTRNVVLWDQDVLDRVALLKRNEEALDAIARRTVQAASVPQYSRRPADTTDRAALGRSLLARNRGDVAAAQREAKALYPGLSEDIGDWIEQNRDRWQESEPGEAMYSRAVPDRDYTPEQEAALAKIGPESPSMWTRRKLTEALENWQYKVRQGTIDQFDKLLRNDRAAYGKDVVDTDTAKSAWVLARMSKAAEGALQAMIYHGRPFMDNGAINVDENEQSLMAVFAPLQGEVSDFLAWVAGNRAERLRMEPLDEIVRVLRSGQAIDELRRDLAALNLNDIVRELDNRTPESLARQLNGYRGSGLEGAMQAMQAAGFKNSVTYLKNATRERLFDDAEIQGLKALNQGTLPDGQDRDAVYRSVQRDFQQLQKSVLDIAESSGLISAQDRATWEHDFYVPFYRVIEDDAGDVKTRGLSVRSGLVKQRAIEHLKGGKEGLNDLLVNTLMNWNHLLGASLRNQAADRALDTAEKLGIATKLKAAGKGSVYVMRDGQPVHYQVDDPLTLEAITALDWQGMRNPAMRLMRSAKRLFTRVVTISPAFQIANLMRDSIHSIAVTKLGANPMANVARGWKQFDINRGKMLAGGGAFQFGARLEGDSKAIQRHLEKQVKGNFLLADTPNKAWKGLQDALQAWDTFSNRTENVNRAALYQQLRDQGHDHLYASFHARDLMDFSQTGAWASTRFLTMAVPFLNARLQGLDKLGRAGLDPAQRTKFALTIGAVMAASALLYLVNSDDERFRELEEWQRDSYWWFFAGDLVLAIPKPFEVGAMGTLAERALEQAVDAGADGTLFLKRLKHVLLETFSFNPTPQLVAPLLDLYANRDPFRDRPIESMSLQNMSPTQRATVGTSEFAKGVSWLLNPVLETATNSSLSPVQVDYLVAGYFGWIGQQALKVSDLAAKPAVGLPSAHRDWLYDTPLTGDLARRFLPDLDRNAYTKSLTAFYEDLRKKEQLWADFRTHRERGDVNAARGILEQEPGLQLWLTHARRVQRALSDIRKQTNRVQRDGRLSAAERERRIRVLNQQRKDTARAFMSVQG